MNDKLRDYTATAFGLCTSLSLAYVGIDWDSFDLHKSSNMIKLIIMGLPAIGGYVSKIKKPEDIKNPNQNGQG